MAPGPLAAKVSESKKYRFRVAEHTRELCRIVFYEKVESGWEEIGASGYAIQDAKDAGLTDNATWKKHPRNMLYARAMSNGVKWYCPDLFGCAIYTEGDEVDGKSIDSVEQARATVTPPSRPATIRGRFEESKEAPVQEAVVDVVEEEPADAQPKGMSPELREEAVAKIMGMAGQGIPELVQQAAEDVLGFSEISPEALSEATDDDLKQLGVKLRDVINA